MKIHESMNVSLHFKKNFVWLPVCLMWLVGAELYGQTPTVEVMNVTMLKNTTWQHDFYHFNLITPPEVEQDAQMGNAYFNPSSCCNGKKGIKGWNKLNHFFYQPATGKIGRDTVIIEYWLPYGNGGNQTAYKIIHFLVVPSYLTAKRDYASTLEGQPVEIAVLNNDQGNGTNLSVSEVTAVNYGTAEIISADTVVRFTPAPGFTGLASFNYTICDAQGSCSMTTVNVCVVPNTPPVYDSLFITTGKNTPIVVLAEVDSNFVVTHNPGKGILDTLETLLYVPSHDSLGYDQIIFTNPTNNHVRVVQVRILDVPSKNEFLFNDIVYTPLNETIEEVHLLSNDVAPEILTSVSVLGYPNTQQEGQLTYLPGVGKGVYRYDPPANFQGLDQFIYRAKPGINGEYEYAVCYIVVNNLNPVRPVFQITSPKNTPLVLGDHLPFDNYEYSNINYDGDGSVTFYPGYNTITSEFGQTFSGENMLVYEPEAGFTGEEEFEFTYCPGGQTSGCPLVKVEVEVIDISNPQQDTLCAGGDCVWPGDANRDGVVDVRDILPIGLCMGEVGEDRIQGSTAWYGQSSSNWNSLFPNGLGYDAKFIDTNGNGIISSQDTAAIDASYGKFHNLTPESVQITESLPFYLEELDLPETINVGDVFYVPIHLGNDTIPAINAYGLAFELTYDPVIFDANVYFSPNSWMNYNSPILSMTKKPVAGKIDAGYTRTSRIAAHGYGIIGVAEFIVIDDISGTRLKNNATTITLNPMGMMNGSGQVTGLNGNSITINLKGPKEGLGTTTLEDQLKVFPNPASNFVTLHLNGGQEYRMERVVLYNTIGSVVYDSGQTNTKRMQLNVSQMAPGVYTARVFTNSGEVISTKVEIIRN